jgi:hypothetical protein
MCFRLNVCVHFLWSHVRCTHCQANPPFNQTNNIRLRFQKQSLKMEKKAYSPLSLGVLGSVVRERLPLPGLSFLCACAKLRRGVKSAEPYDRGVRQRGGAGGTADRRWKKDCTSEQGLRYCAMKHVRYWSWRSSIHYRNKSKTCNSLRNANCSAFRESSSVPNVNLNVHKSPPLDFVLSHLNPVHTSHSTFLISIFILSFQARRGLHVVSYFLQICTVSLTLTSLPQ